MRMICPAWRGNPNQSGRRIRALDGRNVRPRRGPAGAVGCTRPETPERAGKLGAETFLPAPRAEKSAPDICPGVQRCTLSFFRAPPEAGQTFSLEASRAASLPGKRCAPEGPFPHRRHIPYFSRRTACLAGDGGVPPRRKHPHYLTLRCYARQGTCVIPHAFAPSRAHTLYPSRYVFRAPPEAGP